MLDELLLDEGDPTDQLLRARLRHMAATPTGAAVDSRLQTVTKVGHRRKRTRRAVGGSAMVLLLAVLGTTFASLNETSQGRQQVVTSGDNQQRDVQRRDPDATSTTLDPDGDIETNPQVDVPFISATTVMQPSPATTFRPGTPTTSTTKPPFILSGNSNGPPAVVPGPTPGPNPLPQPGTGPGGGQGTTTTTSGSTTTTTVDPDADCVPTSAVIFLDWLPESDVGLNQRCVRVSPADHLRISRGGILFIEAILLQMRHQDVEKVEDIESGYPLEKLISQCRYQVGECDIDPLSVGERFGNMGRHEIVLGYKAGSTKGVRQVEIFIDPAM